MAGCHVSLNIGRARVVELAGKHLIFLVGHVPQSFVSFRVKTGFDPWLRVPPKVDLLPACPTVAR